MGGVSSLGSGGAASHEQLKVELARAVFWEMDRHEQSLAQQRPCACHALVLVLFWIQSLLACVESAVRFAYHGCAWTLCYLVVMCTCAGESYQAAAQLARSSRYPYAYPAHGGVQQQQQGAEQIKAIVYSGPALQLYHHTRMYALYSWLLVATLSNVLSPCNPPLFVYEDFVSLERPDLPGYRSGGGFWRALLGLVCRNRRVLPEAGVSKGRLAQLLLVSYHPISGCHPASCFGPCCCQGSWQHPRTAADSDRHNNSAKVADEEAQCRCCWDDWPERLYREEHRVAEERTQATKKFYQEAYNVNSFDELFEVAKKSNSIPLANSRRMTDVGSGSLGRSMSSRPSVSVAVPVSQPALEA